MSHTSYQYRGNELEVFSNARRWKDYWRSQITEFIAGDVLEVGAGIGTNTEHLQTPAVRSWHCLEPDGQLTARLATAVEHLPQCTVTTGTTQSLDGAHYDVVLYVDVLEHIEDDRGELERAASLLRTGGRLIVLAPAHQWLYSPFDAAIGHYRRYTAKGLRRLSPANCELRKLIYLDSVGVALSLANAALLRQYNPTLRQILIWDGYVVPISRVTDRLAGYRIGKSVLSVWSRL